MHLCRGDHRYLTVKLLADFVEALEGPLVGYQRVPWLHWLADVVNGLLPLHHVGQLEPGRLPAHNVTLL